MLNSYDTFWPFVAYTIRIVELFSAWDAGVRVIGTVDLWMVIAFYALLFALTIYWEAVM